MPNAIWVWDINNDDPIDVANRCTEGKIYYICPFIGYWNSDGSIHYLAEQNYIKNYVNTIRSKNSNFKILGCIQNVWCFWNEPHLDISSPSIRTIMVNNMVSCVQNLALDGINEDTECAHESTGGGFDALVDLWNRMGIAMKNIGKISSADIMTWGGYVDIVANSITIDYLFLMLYNGGGWTGSQLQNAIDKMLNASKSPVIAGLGQYDGDLSAMISSIDKKILTWNSKLKGFSIFEFSTMKSSHWNIWNNWATKDKYSDGYQDICKMPLCDLSVARY